MIFSTKPSGEDQLGLERLRAFQEARSDHLRAQEIQATADQVAEQARLRYEAAKKGLRRVVES